MKSFMEAVREEWKYAVKSVEEIKESGLTGYYAILIDGKDRLMDKTEAEYIADGYEILSEESFRDLILEHDRKMCGNWEEITEEEYDFALNVLPPEKWYDEGFFSCEHWSGDITAFYQKLGGKYYTSLQSVYTPRAEIIEGLKEYIGKF